MHKSRTRLDLTPSTVIVVVLIVGGAGCQSVAHAPGGASVRAADLVKLHEERVGGASTEGLHRPVHRARSPTGDRVASAEPLRTGVESRIFGIFVADAAGRDRIKIAEVVNCFGLAWSPDGSKIAYTEGTRVYVADSDGRTRQMLHAGPGGPYPGASFDLRWRDGGRTLSFVQVENARDPDLANPSRIRVTLGTTAQHTGKQN